MNSLANSRAPEKGSLSNSGLKHKLKLVSFSGIITRTCCTRVEIKKD